MRQLADEDIKALVDEIERRQVHTCRFDSIKAADMEESIRFYKNWNKAFEESKSTVLKTLLTLLVTALVAALGVGSWSKLRQIIGGP